MPKGVILPVKPDGTCYPSGNSPTAVLQGTDFTSLWKSSNGSDKAAETRIFYGQGTNNDITLALVGTGRTKGLSSDELSERNRVIAATGVKALRDVGCTQVDAKNLTLPRHYLIWLLGRD